MEQKIREQLEEIITMESGPLPKHWLMVAYKAYELGQSSKKCKEDKDNPYNIDYKRQTKIDF